MSCDLARAGDVEENLFVVEGRSVNEVGHIFC
jgi:hypothetical protein